MKTLRQLQTDRLNFYKNMLINNIDFEGYNLGEINTLKDKINAVYDTYKSEYIHSNNKHLSDVHNFKEWMQGLPSCLTVTFYNYEILESAKKVGFRLNTEAKEDNFLENYWTNLSIAFFRLKNNF